MANKWSEFSKHTFQIDGENFPIANVWSFFQDIANVRHFPKALTKYDIYLIHCLCMVRIFPTKIYT